MEAGDFAWPSGKEIDVLRILQSEARGAYGLEIVAKSGGKIGRTSIYIFLGRLEEKGFVRVKRTTSDHPGLPRPIYSITAEGTRVLSAYEFTVTKKSRVAR